MEEDGCDEDEDGTLGRELFCESNKQSEVSQTVDTKLTREQCIDGTDSSSGTYFDPSSVL